VGLNVLPFIAVPPWLKGFHYNHCTGGLSIWLDIHHTSLSMNGLVSRLSPFVLSVSKDSERVFSAKLLNLHSAGGH
jgi:hypothetical protein